MLYEVTINGKNYRLKLHQSEGQWSCRLNDQDLQIDPVLARPGVLSLRIGEMAHEIKLERVGGDWYVWVGSRRFAAEVRDPRSLRERMRAGDGHGQRKLTAPMPGKVVRLMVHEGEAVEAGAGVAVVEAMKMQNEIKSPKKGTVQKILVSEGTPVNAGEVLAVIE